jgi:hypothetical protein
MKSYLVDVPVLLSVFIRPNTIKCVFEVIKEARPSKLFLVSDGPRPSHPDDIVKIAESRKIVEDIDWECDIYRLYYDENHGLYSMVREALDFVFYFVDRCIFLEDDVVPSISFFRYCAELLERYQDDLRINTICGMNHLGEYSEPNTDYFFSEAFSIWGFALWRRTYEAFYDQTYGDDKYTIDRLKENTKKYKDFVKALDGYYKNELYEGHIADPEFYFRFIVYSQNKVNILPKYNMIKNIGFCKEATNKQDVPRKMPMSVQKMFQMKTYEYTFPLQHPRYIISDKKYEKKVLRILTRNYPIADFYYNCEGILRRSYFKLITLYKNNYQSRGRIVVSILTLIMVLCGLLLSVYKIAFRKLMRIKNKIKGDCL